MEEEKKEPKIEGYLFPRGGTVWVTVGSRKTAYTVLLPGQHISEPLKREGEVEILEGQGSINGTYVTCDDIGYSTLQRFTTIPPGKRIEVEVFGDQPLVLKCVQILEEFTSNPQSEKTQPAAELLLVAR